MEKITNRDKYAKHFYEFCNKVELNDEFIEALKNHRYFCDEMSTVMKFADPFTRKVYILLEFTRLRSTCEEIIKIMNNCHNEKAAQELALYNTSPGCMEVSTEAHIAVNPSKAEMKGTLYYPMTKKPRGKCVIINNEPNISKESRRFESIFKQLYFDVELLFCLSADEMRQKLQICAKEKSGERADAFIVMIIAHGENESVLGFNTMQDGIAIKWIVDLFSETNCSSLIQTPKLFFFNCCREIVATDSVDISFAENEDPVNVKLSSDENSLEINLSKDENRVLLKLKTLDQNWIHRNKDTFISYSCSQGYECYYDPQFGLTAFGQALSHSIAQYACEENLQSIISRTCDFMDKYVKESHRSTPEIRGQFMRRQLYFNPGFHKK